MDIQKHFDSVKQFNDIASGDFGVTQESLVSQAKIVLEEAKELVDAVRREGEEQVLKEALDCSVVVLGFLYRLEQLGYDVDGAFDAVNQNNLSKFPTDGYLASYSKMAYEESGTDIVISEKYGYYVLTDENGKVRKPLGYKKAYVSPYTPTFLAVDFHPTKQVGTDVNDA